MLHLTRRNLGLLGGAAAMSIASPALAETALERIKRSGVVNVGTEAAYPPFEFVRDGKIVGYGADILAVVVKTLGVKLNQLDLPWQGILPGLLAGKFDFVATTVGISEERAKRYAYTLPIFSGAPYAMKRKGDPMAALGDLNGKVVATQLASSLEPVARGLNETLKAQGGPGFKDLRLFTAFTDCYVALASREVDAVIQSLPTLSTLVREKPDTFALMVAVPPVNPYIYSAWVTRPTDLDLRDLISSVIRTMRDDGRLAELQEKWIGFKVAIPDTGYLPPGAF